MILLVFMQLFLMYICIYMLVKCFMIMDLRIFRCLFALILNNVILF